MLRPFGGNDIRTALCALIERYSIHRRSSLRFFWGDLIRISGTIEKRVQAQLRAGKGILKVTREVGVGTGTVQRIKVEMASFFVGAAALGRPTNKIRAPWPEPLGLSLRGGNRISTPL